MDATAVYPNSAPVLAAHGLGGTLAGNDPDHVPLEPDLINDARRRLAPGGCAVDASGVMRLHVRNALGYAFLRPHHRDKLYPRDTKKVTHLRDALNESVFYRRDYRDFVPHDLLMDFILNENPPQEDISQMVKWQGNAIAGVDCGQDGHVVFYPTGHVLQQACAWYSKGESEEDPPCSSTVIETGARIRQIAVMGSKDAYRSTSASKIYAAVRGSTNCTIVAAPSRVTPQNVRKMQAKAKISFPEMINHITGSPHAEAELAIVTDGVVRCWDPESGIRTVNKGFMNMADRVLRCEYSSHPGVLWTANRIKVSTLDLRQPSQHTSTLFDLTGAGAYITIYNVKRRARNPFQFVVGTGVSVELMDSRMAKQPLISWIQPQDYSRESESEYSFGAIDEVDLSRNANDERGYIVSSLKRAKVTTLFPFERNRKRKRDKVMSLTPLRSNGDDDYSMTTPRINTEQLIASDAPLDLHMEDGGEYTHLTGMCALRDEDSASASIYQLNSAGDLYSHRVSLGRSQTYHTAVQPELPCGVVAQDDPADYSLPRTLPIPLDTILPELDTETLQKFIILPVKALRRQFPRLPHDGEVSVETEGHEDDEATSVSTDSNQDRRTNTEDSAAIAVDISETGSGSVDSGATLQARTESVEDDGRSEAVPPTFSTRRRSFDHDELTEKLLRLCEPSASLFQLHRYALDKLKIELSSSELLRLLRASSQFRIRTVHQAFPADTLRVIDPSSPGADDVHFRQGDPRLATCTCRPGSLRSQSPCKSWSCVMPHAIVVFSASPELHLDDTAPSSAVLQEISDELTDIITATRAVYDGVYESESESESE
ncbi:hypothetical protein PF003_g5763 [Phytophthora fragariae]|nr:hypothetical protein PF003_g5763 [Phytophthora fragariae]